jgi:Single-stranded DNA-binding protein
MLQNIQIIGNLVQDAEVRAGKDGKEFVSFRLAVNEGTGEEKKTTYYDVSYVKSGLLQYLRKGQGLFVSGRLSISAVCKDEKAYVNAYVSAKDVILLGGARDN